MSGFTWMKQNGWKGDVDLRVTGDHGDVADDAKLPGFSALGLNYLHLEIIDGHAPTADQANQFLSFVTNPANQPVEVHCRGGYGRAGTMVALYRYAVQGWPMDQAIAESRLFSGGVSEAQKAWLLQWAKDHAPASFKS
jgi:protein-tyrosine phosphatase